MSTVLDRPVFDALEEYSRMSPEDLTAIVRGHKERLGSKLLILGHFYQKPEVIDLADITGDSFGLSKAAAEAEECETILFCGVHFMAESARILARPDQVVLHPDKRAGCPMADMADLDTVTQAWNELAEVTDIDRVIPVTYMNSDADLKAFCGERGGVVCTSSNATKVYDWCFERGDKILFFPDEHLGRNTGNLQGIPKDQMLVWDRKERLGGLSEQEIAKSKVLLWKGFCHVHTHFTVEHIQTIRETEPDAKVIVHPECPEEVVALADGCGSTDYIKRYVEAAPVGTTIYIGTELNHSVNLARLHADKTIKTLSRSLCPNMWKIGLNDMAYTLDQEGRVNRIELPDSIQVPARLALQRMLEVA
jgi:quinolinate synthase